MRNAHLECVGVYEREGQVERQRPLARRDVHRRRAQRAARLFLPDGEDDVSGLALAQDREAREAHVGHPRAATEHEGSSLQSATVRHAGR